MSFDQILNQSNAASEEDRDFTERLFTELKDKGIKVVIRSDQAAENVRYTLGLLGINTADINIIGHYNNNGIESKNISKNTGILHLNDANMSGSLGVVDFEYNKKNNLYREIYISVILNAINDLFYNGQQEIKLANNQILKRNTDNETVSLISTTDGSENKIEYHSGTLLNSTDTLIRKFMIFNEPAKILENLTQRSNSAKALKEKLIGEINQIIDNRRKLLYGDNQHFKSLTSDFG